MDEKKKMDEMGAERLADSMREARKGIAERRAATDASKSDIDWGYDEGLSAALNILHHAEFMELVKQARSKNG